MTHSDERLGTESVGRLIFRMSLPAIAAQCINMLYNLVDRVYIGHMAQNGRQALIGLGLAAPILTLLSAFSAFVGTGGAPLAAMALGKGDRERAEKILSNGVTLLCMFAVTGGLAAFFFREPLLYLVGASEETYPFASSYLSVYLTGTLAVMLSMGLNTYMTAQGRSGMAMLAVVIGAGLNIALDPIFIFACGMGVQGAALATVISQLASAVFVLAVLCSPRASLRIRFSAMRPDGKIVLTIFSLGISPFVMTSTESLISFVMNGSLQRFGGDLYVGTLTVMQSIMQVLTVPVSGFTQGITPVISYNYGAGNIPRVKKAIRCAFLVLVPYTVLFAVCTMTMPEFFASVITSDQDLIALAGRAMPVFFAGMLIFGIQRACQTSFLAMGQAKLSLFIAMLRKVILLAPLAFFLPRMTGEAFSVYFAEPISDACAATVCGILFLCNIRKILAKAGGTRQIRA